MISVPDDPTTFVREFLPDQFGAVKAQLAGASSLGSVTLRVLGAGEWTLRVNQGELEVLTGMEADVLLQLTVAEEDFAILFAESARRGLAHSGGMAVRGFRALNLEPDVARGLRHVPGSLLTRVHDGPRTRRVLATPGQRVADLESAECTLLVELDDWALMQEGRAKPTDLFMTGRLRFLGNIQIALALAGVLS